MAIKAVAVDDENTQHLIIGLSRNNVNDLLDGLRAFRKSNTVGVFWGLWFPEILI